MNDEIAKVKTPTKEFQEKITDKIREDIGKFIPDSVLKSMVEKSVNEIFFKREIETDRWGNKLKDSPSWFMQEIKNLVEPQVRESVKAIIEENKEYITNIIKATVEGNITTLAISQQIGYRIAAEISTAISALNLR